MDVLRIRERIVDWILSSFRTREESGRRLPPDATEANSPMSLVDEYARLLLAEAREEVGRADQKASILFAGAAVAMAAIVQGLVGSGWSPADLGMPWTIGWWLTTGLSIGALFCLARAVVPRTKASGAKLPNHVFYFENAADFSGTAELQAALLGDETSRLHRSVHQLWHISRIVRTKYTWIRRAMVCLGASLVIALVTVTGSDWG